MFLEVFLYVGDLDEHLNYFTDFLKIVLNATLGNVVILISHDPYRDAITESIIKLIQIRYGYNCWEIEDADDLSCLK